MWGKIEKVLILVNIVTKRDHFSLGLFNINTCKENNRPVKWKTDLANYRALLHVCFLSSIHRINWHNQLGAKTMGYRDIFYHAYNVVLMLHYSNAKLLGKY